MSDKTKKTAAEGKPEEHKDESKHAHHKITHVTHKPHSNNINFNDRKSPSVRHGKKKAEKKAKKATAAQVAVTLAQQEIRIHFSKGNRNLVNAHSIDNPAPPTVYEDLIEGVLRMMEDYFQFLFDIPDGKDANTVTVLNGIVASIGKKIVRTDELGRTIEIEITDVLTDSLDKFLEGIEFTVTITVSGTPTVTKYTFPENEDDGTDESAYLGYSHFRYENPGGTLSGGEYKSEYAPMYFRGSPDTRTTTPSETIDDNSPVHGTNYPDLPPGEYFIKDLPEEADKDDPYNIAPTVTVSFEGMELEFEIEITQVVDENGNVTTKHTITYHVKVKKDA